MISLGKSGKFPSFTFIFNGVKISYIPINLVKFFITSNLAYTKLQNRYLRAWTKDELRMPCLNTFWYDWINQIFDKLHIKIDEKLKNAESINLLLDGSTDQPNSECLVDYMKNWIYKKLI